MARDFIKELRAEARTIFLTTHNLPEADELCDLIRVFRSRLLKLDTPANLRAGLFGQGTRVRVAGDAAAWPALAQAQPFVRGAELRDGALELLARRPRPAQPHAGAGAGRCRRPDLLCSNQSVTRSKTCTSSWCRRRKRRSGRPRRAHGPGS